MGAHVSRQPIDISVHFGKEFVDVGRSFALYSLERQSTLGEYIVLATDPAIAI